MNVDTYFNGSLTSSYCNKKKTMTQLKTLMCGVCIEFSNVYYIYHCV